MRIRYGRGLRPLVAALAMVAMGVPAWSVPTARAAGAADAQASAVVRLINGERAYLGKPALSLDSYLASRARDGAVWCPNNSALVMTGRAKDMAVSGYFSHNLRLCTQYTIIDALKTWGYTGGRGEIITYNSAGASTVNYAYGCSPSVSSCPGSATSTYDTVARAMSGWMHSSVHYSIITGGYNRVGCGSWVNSSGTHYYACLFAMGGSPIVTPKPISTPRPTAESTPEAPKQPPPGPTPAGASAWVILPSESPDVAVADAAALDGGPAGQRPDGVSPKRDGLLVGRSSNPAQDPAEGLPQVAQATLATVGAALTLLIVWLRLGLRRRYRPRGARA